MPLKRGCHVAPAPVWCLIVAMDRVMWRRGVGGDLLLNDVLPSSSREFSMEYFKFIAPPPSPPLHKRARTYIFGGARLQLPLSTKLGGRAEPLKAVTSDICTTKELYFVAHKQ